MNRSIGGICLVFLFILTANPLFNFASPASASIVWSDDFNDENYDGWTIKGLDASDLEDYNNWVDTAGSADIINDELRFTGPPIFRNFTFAVHESSVAYGIWEFDVSVRPIYGTSNHTHIYFIDPRPVEDVPKYDTTFSGYDIMIYSAPWTIEVPSGIEVEDDTAPSFLLIKRPGIILMGSYTVDEINGTYHIKVTRDETGRFKVYINDTLRIEAVDNRWTTSQSFYLTSESGIGYDNIVVSDDVIPPDETTTTTTPTTTPGFSTELLVILIVAPVGIVFALVIIAKRRKRF
ncbi:MAG: hypothetical protein KAQ65_04360 [Candidatus Thorarchaeota archaeon]|nr:hypothetical protein [Candidatus Thorarchaeota archaeon]